MFMTSMTTLLLCGAEMHFSLFHHIVLVYPAYNIPAFDYSPNRKIP